MTASGLLLKRLIEPDGALPIKWQLDCPTRGVVILDVAVGEVATSTPLHWRAGDWSKPPLDVRLSDDGEVESIQFVFQDESVDVGDVVPPTDTATGLPVFDVGAWPSDRYYDVRVPVTTLRLPSGHLYAVIGDSQPSRSVSVTWGLRFDIDPADQLVGIALGPLTADEWQLIEASAPLSDT
jgi:hypothetical protein